MTRYDAVNYISHGIAKVPGKSESRTVHGAEEETGGEEPFMDLEGLEMEIPEEPEDEDLKP